ncbi:uncharacterized protein LOC136038286 isoform X3 [Artemia franciscana]|uniref:uncharacterized protein LOC136038286 isoform X3 n=1 Tax=Artemia franciscana TaxID=6661 RepID=UPI0032D9F18E
MSVPSVALILEHLKIDRTGLTCPKPQYPKSYWYQPDPKSCCQECKILEPTQSTKKYEKDGEQDEEAQGRNVIESPSSVAIPLKNIACWQQYYILMTAHAFVRLLVLLFTEDRGCCRGFTK